MITSYIDQEGSIHLTASFSTPFVIIDKVSLWWCIFEAGNTLRCSSFIE